MYLLGRTESNQPFLLVVDSGKLRGSRGVATLELLKGSPLVRNEPDLIGVLLKLSLDGSKLSTE